MGRGPANPDTEVICNRKISNEHCTIKCPHGVIHKKDECTKNEFCQIVGENVKCHKPTKKELATHK